MNHSAWLALVALSEPVLPDPLQISARCDLMAPDEAPLALSSRTKAMATFQWGESTVAYTLIDKPIPSHQLEGPCECAWYWPTAKQEFSRHTAHLIVALIDEGRDRMAKAVKLTRISAALLATDEAIGLQWGGSRQVHAPSAFIDLASKMAPDDLPLYLWIDFRIEPIGSNTWRLFTTGLNAFGKLELEVGHYEGDPQELVHHVYNMAHFQLEKPNGMKGGDTVGLPGDVQATVEEAKSFVGDDQDVLRIEFN
jgi:hypothetical protein